MGIRIPALLEAILDATATKTNAEARIAGLRAVLDTEARRRYAEEGAAPSWKRRDVGTVRLDEPGEWRATIADPAAFGSYVAQHHPTEANGILEVPADRLEEALDALRFAGIELVDSRVEVRATFATKYLEGLLVDVEEQADEDGSVDRTITVVDPATGAIVDGTSANRAAAKLVVTLDRDLRAAVIEQAKAEAEALLTEVTGEQPAEPRAEGREVTLDELVANGTVTPASALTTMGALPDDTYRPNVVEAAAGILERRGHRRPYVGEGADGARRSAQIDSTEAEGLDRDDPRRDEVLASAVAWEAQAAELEADEQLAEEAREESPAPAQEAAKPLREKLAEQLDVTVDEAGVRAIEAMDNREALRRLARAKGIPAGGTKRELAERLYAAGVRA